jgi:hypothetical protein
MLWTIGAGVAFALGAVVYIASRSPDHTYLLPHTLALAVGPGIVPGFVGASLPSLVHVFAFTLLTAAVLAPRTAAAAAAIAAAWGAADVLFELGQYPTIATAVAAALPTWFRGVPLLENVGPYFLNGTFDPADLVATAAGAAAAYLTIVLSSRQGEVS